MEITANEEKEQRKIGKNYLLETTVPKRLSYSYVLRKKPKKEKKKRKKYG